MLTGPNGDMPIAPIYWYTFTYQVADNVTGWNDEPDGHDRPDQGRASAES